MSWHSPERESNRVLGVSLHTRICDLFGIEVPIVLAGMGGASTPALAAAVSNAGGLGILGAAACSPDELREWVRKTRALTDKPFGVDTLLPASVQRASYAQAPGPTPQERLPELLAFAREFMEKEGLEAPRRPADERRRETFTKDFFAAQMEVVIEERVPVYASGLGDPGPWMERMRANGTKVMAVVGAVRHARKVAASGVDVIVAQGHDAGGHNSPVGTMALIPQVVDAVAPLPVLGRRRHHGRARRRRGADARRRRRVGGQRVPRHERGRHLRVPEEGDRRGDRREHGGEPRAHRQARAHDPQQVDRRARRVGARAAADAVPGRGLGSDPGRSLRGGARRRRARLRGPGHRHDHVDPSGGRGAARARGRRRTRARRCGADGPIVGGARHALLRLDPGAVLLALGVAFGVFFAIATPPHDPPDEERHHARAWLVSNGWLGVVGGAPGHAASVPREITQLHPPGHHRNPASERAPKWRASPHTFAERRAGLEGALARWDLQPVRYVTPYNPLVYAPYVPALWLARAFDLSAAAELLLARLAGLACWLAGVVATLRIAPCQRWLITAVALLPMSLFQAGSISADPPTQLAIFWFFAEWLRAAGRDGETRGPRDLARLLAAACALGLVKPGYAPLALACVALPGAPGRRAALGAAALAAAVLPTLAWAAVVAAAEEPALVPGADLAGQLRFVLGHPLRFLAAIASTVVALAGAWLEGMVAQLGHFDVEIPTAVTALGLAAVTASASLDRGRLGLATRLGALAAFGITSVAVMAMAYLGWTPVGADRIPGIQGRYFLLMLPFALLAAPRIPRLPEPRLRLAVASALALVLAVTSVALVRVYYAL